MNSLNRDMQRRLYLLIALACASLVTVAGVFWTGARIAAHSGARPGTPGVPYPNMPAIAPIGVRVDKYLDVPDSAKGPIVDPAKGYRTQKLGEGLYMITDGATQSMFMTYEEGVVVVDAPPLDDLLSVGQVEELLVVLAQRILRQARERLLELDLRLLDQRQLLRGRRSLALQPRLGLRRSRLRDAQLLSHRVALGPDLSGLRARGVAAGPGGLALSVRVGGAGTGHRPAGGESGGHARHRDIMTPTA